ncbi:hypothetical protein CCAX7_17300 [Capsulimonas corticalis]|uniref:Uncharacterized protein n=1 Tax=Capsulimonas corticalis TaxID=2219043 RepID=A0A402D3W6_9BACT|nr:hypothetical protein [Capsulimonas corticalis]BDI29679.1 hypothetical protein CCAX7_17300 [Capsulimonas corticalis]
MYNNDRRRAFVFTLALLGALATAAYADIAAGARSAIQNTYRQQNAALDRKDAAGALAHTSPDYVGTDLKGDQFNLQARKDGLPAIFALVKSMRTTTRIVTFALQSTRAAADVKAVERQEVTIHNAQTGAEQSGVMDMTVLDHWISTDQGWMLQSRRQLDYKRLQ